MKYITLDHELKCIWNRQKSFYGKAKVETTYNMQTGEKEKVVLVSYQTKVVEIDKQGILKKLWDGYSATTMKHINEFLEQCGGEKLSKKEWLSLQCE